MAIEFTPDGREIPDPTPVEIPAGYKRPESLVDMIKRLVRNDVSQFARDHGAESFEEANNFGEDEDEDDDLTVYEEMADDDFVDKVKAHKQQLEEQDAESKRRDRLQREGKGKPSRNDDEHDGDREEDTEQRAPNMASGRKHDKGRSRARVADRGQDQSESEED